LNFYYVRLDGNFYRQYAMHDAPDQYKRFSYSASAAFLLFYFPWEIIARFGYNAPYLMLKKDIYALFHENEGHFLPILSNFVHNLGVLVVCHKF